MPTILPQKVIVSITIQFTVLIVLLMFRLSNNNLATFVNLFKWPNPFIICLVYFIFYLYSLHLPRDLI